MRIVSYLLCTIFAHTPPSSPQMYRRSNKTGFNKPVTRKYAKRDWKELKRSPSFRLPPTNFGLGAGQRNRSDGLPQSIMQKLRYTGTGSVVTTNVLNNFSAVTYFLDPYNIRTQSAPVAHQPTFFDQWGALYTNQRVRAWKVRITAQCSSASPAYFGSTFVAPGNTGGNITTYLDLAQDYRAKSGIVHNTGSGVTVHKHYHTLRDLAGNVDPTDDTYGGTQLAPAVEYPLLIMGATNSAAQVSGVAYQVDIVFYVEFYSPITAGISAA